MCDTTSISSACTSKTGSESGTAGIVNPDVTVAYVKSCHTCRNGSNTMNCYIRGPHKDYPCLPWDYGTHISPEGDFCVPCVDTFQAGGFAEEYQTLRKFKRALKTEANLLDEFIAARSELISKVNEGCLGLRRSVQKKADLKATSFLFVVLVNAVMDQPVSEYKTKKQV